MITAAVIAEFNPFHNGHKFLFDSVKSTLHADNIIVILSGDFVQRGEAAIVNKQIRSKAAVCEGADLVLMLPSVYSTASADLFAYGAITLLDRLGCVDYVCFASENNDEASLNEIAEKLFKDESFKDSEIRKLMKNGLTYPQARAELFPEYKEILEKPNNILAIEYLKALKELKSTMKPFIISRKGSGYNDKAVTGSIPGALAIRNVLYNAKSIDEIKDYVPLNTYSLLKDEFNRLLPVKSDYFSDELYYSLLLNKDNLIDYMDVSESLSNKIKKALISYESYSSFCETLKSRELTYSRISRALLHILLGIKKDGDYYKNAARKMNYLRILAKSDRCATILHEIGSKSDLKLIANVPKNVKDFNEETAEIFEIDLFAASLYDRIAYKAFGTTPIHEYSKKYL